jgi:hypothetical protein
MKNLIAKMLAALALAATMVTAQPALAGDRPLVLEGTQTKQLPAATALQLQAPTTGSATINLPHGTAPTSPSNGDCWTTTSGLFCQINGATTGPYASGGGSLAVKDEGSTLTSAATSINFTGTGVTASNVSGAVTVNVPSASGGIFDLSAGVPAASAFTNINFGTGTTKGEVSGKAVWVATTSASSGTGMQGLAKAVPATPYRVAILVQQNTPGSDSWVAVGFRDSATGKLTIVNQNLATADVQNYSGPSSFAGNLVGSVGPEAVWYGAEDDGTNISLEWSVDGVNFVKLYTVAKASGYQGSSGYNQIFVATRTNNSLPSVVTIRCYDENGLSRTFP